MHSSPPTLHGADTTMPYVTFTSDPTVLQVTSDLANNRSTGVFTSSDGRIITITGASTASMERLCFGVSVAYASQYRRPPHTNLLGSCGVMYLCKSGAWELYPAERLLTTLNRTAEPSGIHCDLAANRCAAALMLVHLSDEASRDYYDYVKPTEGLKVGKLWRIKPIATKANHPYPAKPRPLEIPVRCSTQRHFLATRTTPGKSDFTARVIVEAWDYRDGSGVDLRSFAAGLAGESLDVHGGVPRSVIDACVGRCYAS